MSVSIRPAGLEGLLLVEGPCFRDDRGFFAEAYQKRRYAEAGITDDFVQDNHSRSRRGVLRGLHYQDMRAPMSKLVRCVNGRIVDVAVDLRVGSPTFARWFSAELSDANQLQLYIPVGFAHGFVALSDWADVEYKCGGYYQPGAEATLAWNDESLKIDWPITAPTLSAKDQRGMTLREYLQKPAFRYQAQP